MYIYVYIYIYIYHHWRILWTSYRKLARVGFEPTTAELRSDVLTHWAIRLWARLAPRANFVQLLQFHRLFSVRFQFGYCFVSRHVYFNRNFLEVNLMSVVEWTDIYGIHRWRILWSSYRKLTWVGFESHDHWILFRLSNPLSYQAVSSTRTQIQLYTATPISFPCSLFTIRFGHCLRQSPHLLQAKLRTGNHVNHVIYMVFKRSNIHFNKFWPEGFFR